MVHTWQDVDKHVLLVQAVGVYGVLLVHHRLSELRLVLASSRRLPINKASVNILIELFGLPQLPEHRGILDVRPGLLHVGAESLEDIGWQVHELVGGAMVLSPYGILLDHCAVRHLVQEERGLLHVVVEVVGAAAEILIETVVQKLVVSH